MTFIKRLFLLFIILLLSISFSCKKKGDEKIDNEDGNSEEKPSVIVDDKKPSIEITGVEDLLIDESIKLELVKKDITEDGIVSWKSSDNKIARVSYNGTVKGISAGEVTITATFGDLTATAKIHVYAPEITSFNIEMDNLFEVGGSYKYNKQILPEKAIQDLDIEYDKDYINIEGKIVHALKEGNTKIIFKSKADNNIYQEFDVEIKESKAPTITKKEGYSELLEVNYADKKGLVADLDIVDNVDGDVSDLITYKIEDLITYGEHDITINAVDKVGNSTSFTRRIKVVWNYHIKFIGHAGCTFAVPNTEEAFIFAAKNLQYQALECDVQTTKDGIYVTNHDSTINGIKISEHTYDELKDIEIKYGQYTGHLCTLERYLEICKEYNVEAIIELKGSSPGISTSNQDDIPRLMKFITDKGMYDNSTILTSMSICLIRIRQEGYDIPCQLLVNSCEDQNTLNLCNIYNFDLSTNVTYGGPNSDEWLNKYREGGHKISVWTFSGDYSQVQTWIDKGVDYVTCDCHYMYQLELK